MSCGVGRMHGLYPMLLWLWCRLAAAAPILPLAWEPPYAVGRALKKTKDKNKIKQQQQKTTKWMKEKVKREILKIF